MHTVAVADDLDRILRDREVRAVYQPIIDLATGVAIGFEALARGPEGSPLETPDALFAAARAAGRVCELDWVCRVAALQGALDAGMDTSVNLFVNVEPEAIDSRPSPEVLNLVREASRELRIVVEVTERALTGAPAQLLRAVAAVRDFGWGIALDDVGADVASLALMPFLRPDVVKLDLRLVQQRPDHEIAAIVAAVNAHAERTGAFVLAEGIETPTHLDAALAMGATLGQGWLYGRPTRLPDDLARLSGAIGVRPAPLPPARTPMTAATRSRAPRRSTKPLLIEMSRHLERQALELGAPGVVLSAFQTADRFTPGTRALYGRLASRSALVGALGRGMADEPAPGVRGGRIDADDPLVDEWAIAVIGPHFAAALAAIDLGDCGSECERRFDYVLTYDRDLAVEVAESLLARIDPHRTPPRQFGRTV